MDHNVNGNRKQPKLELVPVRSLDSIIPAPENDDIYGAISWDDPEISELARSIKEHGVREPLLISRDGYLISGHRRRIASYVAGLEEVPVQINPISRKENPREFVKLLVEMNSQRIKSTSSLFHESLIKIDPKSAHKKIVNERKEKDLERSAHDLSAIKPKHNDQDSYKKLTNLLTRARLESLVSWEAIDDETRPVMEHRAFWNMAEFFR